MDLCDSAETVVVETQMETGYFFAASPIRNLNDNCYLGGRGGSDINKLPWMDRFFNISSSEVTGWPTTHEIEGMTVTSETQDCPVAMFPNPVNRSITTPRYMEMAHT